jgi:hypothetical protein
VILSHDWHLSISVHNSISVLAVAVESNSFLVFRVRVLIINCLFDTLGRIATDATAKKTMVQMDVLLIKGEPHMARVNCASFAISAIGKRNVLVTKGVLDKFKHMGRNPNPTTGAMRAFEVAVLTDPLDDGHVIAMPPTTVAVSQQNIGHGRSVKKKNEAQ